MQRIRTVKPELFRHEGLFEAEKFYQLPLRLAFIGLFSCCDREGRFRWKPNQLKLDIFPYDDGFDMSRVLDALLTRGFIVKYAWKGELYGCIPSWHKHQRVNHRESPSLLPGFDDDEAVLEDSKNDASTTREPPVKHASAACLGIPGGKGTGREVEREGEMERELEGNVRHTSMTRGARDNDASSTRQARDGQASVMRDARDSDVSLLIFEHWKQVMGLPDALLDNKRRESIGKALAMGYTAEQLCHAIEGCRNTPHNMGKNDNGERYDGLHIILRDADQIDRFIRNYYQPPRIATQEGKRMTANIQNLQNWVDKKINQVEITDNQKIEEKDEA